jgi:hypothetical protein
MEQMIAFCGAVCTECQAYIATKGDDNSKRGETAKKWSNLYKVDIKPEDINCHGCIAKGESVFSHCNVCEIRKCGQERDVENCAFCDAYICDKLNEFFKIVPKAKRTLDAIRNN